MCIEMINISEFQTFLYPHNPSLESGKYLVKTISTGPLKSVQYLQARVIVTRDKFSIDVNNQIVTHISKTKLL